MVGSILLIVRDQLFGVLSTGKNLLFDEVVKSLSVRPVLEVEVKALSVVLAFDVDALFCSIMFKDQLFKHEESTLVINLLSDLYTRLPKMGRVCFLAVVALKVHDNEFDDKCLL